MTEQRFCSTRCLPTGINYLDFLFDVTDLSEEEIPYLGILKAVLGYMNTSRYGYADLANEINLVYRRRFLFNRGLCLP